MAIEIFTDKFLNAVQSLVGRHHTIYPRLPPQGVFFEALVEQAFRKAGWSVDDLVASVPNSPWHDLLVGGVKLSIKSETGKSTRAATISITKLCTTETGEWTVGALVDHTFAHLARHDTMLMVRAIWREHAFDYQLLEIPLDLLERMKGASFSEVGKRPGRRSLAADVCDGKQKLFRVHFDGADGKCQIHGLDVNLCRSLRQWRQPIK
jgi:Type II site-specific deoxyribonuclease